MSGTLAPRGFAALLLGPLLGLAGCASTPPPAAGLAHPYKVVLLPVEGADAALRPPAEGAADGQLPFALTPEELRGTITRGIVDSAVFSQVVLADDAALRADAGGDRIAAAAGMARREQADLILLVRVNSARMRDLGANGSAFWSTLTWFMIPAPVWGADDRSYATTLSVQAELYDPTDAAKPTASIVASSGEQELDLFDRGVNAWVLIKPPPWIEGDPETVSKTLTKRAVAQLMSELVQELRTREIPSRFDLDVVRDGGDVVVRVSSRRKLRSLEVLFAGATVRAWAERETDELLDASAPTDGTVSYVARVAIPPAEGTTDSVVRVIVEDEGGGREVRTLLFEEAR